MLFLCAGRVPERVGISIGIPKSILNTLRRGLFHSCDGVGSDRRASGGLRMVIREERKQAAQYTNMREQMGLGRSDCLGLPDAFVDTAGQPAKICTTPNSQRRRQISTIRNNQT
jgi:hypothetical protein